MALNELIFILFYICIFFSIILFLLFSAIIVRPLRKNPKTRDHLGITPLEVMKVLRVASALSLPKKLQLKMENGYLGAMCANSEILKKHTSTFGKLFANILFFFANLTVVLLLACAFIDVF